MLTSFSMCPCRSNLLYDACCNRYHQGQRPALAIDLMRSRFSAYALGLADYIIDTTHQKNQHFMVNKEAWRKDILQFCQSTKFDDLTINDFVDGDNRATVTFTAKLTKDGKDTSFSETSTFVRENGRWLYRSGVTSKA